VVSDGCGKCTAGPFLNCRNTINCKRSSHIEPIRDETTKGRFKSPVGGRYVSQTAWPCALGVPEKQDPSELTLRRIGDFAAGGWWETAGLSFPTEPGKCRLLASSPRLPTGPTWPLDDGISVNGMMEGRRHTWRQLGRVGVAAGEGGAADPWS
jgi:hypothetical protein